MIRTFLFKATSFAAVAAATVVVTASSAAAQGPANVLNVVGQAQVSSPGVGSGFPLFIDFLSGAAYPPSTVGNGVPGNVFSGVASGLFSGIPGGSNGVIQDIMIGAGGSPTTTNPAAASSTFLTIGGYTFSLTGAGSGSTFGPITLQDRTGGAVASFDVTGNVTGAGFTPGSTYLGLFTAQFVGQTAAQVFDEVNHGGSPKVTFSANFSATPASVVPEPSTYALLATGIGALAFAARRRRLQA